MRMKASSANPTNKPLVTALGLTLIERNLYWLLAAGYKDIVIVLRAEDETSRSWAESRGTPLAKAFKADVSIYLESEPLGTIGALAEVHGDAENALVIYTDNLSDLSLNDFLRFHEQHKAAVTVAVHQHSVSVPYGCIDSDGIHVTGYREKPTIKMDVASGIYLFSREAYLLLESGASIGTNKLIERALSENCEVIQYQHDARWIDVNTASELERAIEMIANNESMECWFERVDVEVVGACIMGAEGVLLEKRDPKTQFYAGTWDTPGGKIEAGETPEQAIRRELKEELLLTEMQIGKTHAFDDIDLSSGRVFRHHVFEIITTQKPQANEGQQLGWHSNVQASEKMSPIVFRSLGALGLS